MKRWNISWDAMLIVAIVAVAGVCSQSQQVAFADDNAEEKGRVVQISPDSEAAEPLPEAEAEVEPTYWIGVRGRGVQSPVLRTHLQLAENMGVVVEQVLEESPARKAGLRKHDILLRANGEAVHDMQVLSELVRESQEQPIELRLIRLGKEETISVIPEKRPQQLPASNDLNSQGRLGDRFGAGAGRADALRQLLEQMQRGGGLQAGMQLLGPGLFEGNPPVQLAMPDGVSISVTRKNGEPAQVTIKRGDESWQVTEGDAEALKQLPEDIQPLAQRALQPSGANPLQGMQFDFNKNLEELIPRGLGGLGGGLGGGVIPAPRQDLSQKEKELSERLQRMEKDLRKLQERFLQEELPAK